MKVSFDFDSTLDRSDVQDLARKLVQLGHQVWIVTSRFSDSEILERNWHHLKSQNQKVFRIAQECGISKDHIHFTNMQSKSVFLKGKGFRFHLDDDSIELLDILESKDECLAVNVEQSDWLQTCLSAVGYEL